MQCDGGSPGFDRTIARMPSIIRSPLAARADHRLDELVVGIFVAAAHQLGERLPAIGPIVEAAGEVERADRIVRGPNRENARPAPRRRPCDVADGRGFGRLQVFAEPPAAVEPRRRERVRPWRFGRRRHQDHLLDVERRRAPRPAASRLAGRSHSRWVSPRQ